VEESYDNDKDNKMPTTYDQTCIVHYPDGSKTYVISPRPVAPAILGEDEDGIIRGHIFEDIEKVPCYWERNFLAEYEWHPDGDVIRTDPNGTITIWHRKPTIQDIIFSNFKSHCLQINADGSCKLKGLDGENKEFTMYWFEDREVDEPSDEYWMDDLNCMMGKCAPDVVPDGWYCRKCHTSRCHHVSESAKKHYKYNNESPTTTSCLCEIKC